MAQFTSSGERNRRVTIQAQSNAPDPVTGKPAKGWANVATVWAKIAGVSSKEVYQAGQFTAQITHVIRVVWSADLRLAGGMQVLYIGSYGTRTFTVQAVENVNEANREISLMCIEIDGVAS